MSTGETASPGRAAYEAYWPVKSGAVLCPWGHLADGDRAAWEAAADAGTLAYMPEDWTSMLLQRDEARAERDKLASAYEHTCTRVQAVLDKALGADNQDGEGIAAGVARLAVQRDEARELLAVVRERLETTAMGMEMSAGTTAPSEKSRIEQGCAAALRGIAGRITVSADG